MYSYSDIWHIADYRTLQEGRALALQPCPQKAQVYHAPFDADWSVQCDTFRHKKKTYSLRFTYNTASKRFTHMQCTCQEFTGESPCKHLVALMLVANEPMTVQENAEKEQLLAKREEQERQAFLDQLADWHMPSVDASMPPVHLVARLEPTRAVERSGVMVAVGGDAPPNCLLFSLRMGRTRMYAVRNVVLLAQRMRLHERASYGRDLTFSHTEAEVAPEDLPLLQTAVMLCQMGAPHTKDGQLVLRGATLDLVMRQLMGSTVQLSDSDGTRTVPLKPEELPLPVQFTPIDGDAAALRIDMQRRLLGDKGLYRFDIDGIYYTVDEAFDRLVGLLHIASRYPNGMRLNDEMLTTVCAGLLAPAGEGVTVEQGQPLVDAHLPAPMTAHFFVEDGGDRLLCRVAFDYDGTRVTPQDETPQIRRNRRAERRALQAVQSLFAQEVAPGVYASNPGDDARFSLLTEELHTLRALGDVMLEEKLQNAILRAPWPMQMTVERVGVELLVHMDLGEYTQQELEEAYWAYRQKRRYVKLGDRFMTEAALAQAAQAMELMQGLDVTAQQLADGVNVSAARAPYLEAALAERETMTLRGEKALHSFTEGIRRAQQTQAEPPADLRAELRSYQRTGLSWLAALSDQGFGGILADDMGLGKTVQALAYLLREREQGTALRALVVCPASLQLNWMSEAARFAPTLQCQMLTGSAPTRAKAIAAGAEVTITSYDQLRRDAEAYADIPLTHVLLDEAQAIKNAASVGAKAVKTLRATHRFAMTGTPVENHLGELWSIFDFLMPGYLYSARAFRERLEQPIVREDDEQAMHTLHMLTAPFILRRLKRDVLTDLPEKQETVLTSEMTAEQRKLYRAYALRLAADSDFSDAHGRMQVLAGLTRLRQLCCDPSLCLENYTGGSGKLEQLLTLTDSLLNEGHRLLIFSQFTTMLATIERALAARGVQTFKLTGSTDKQTRMEQVNAFNAGAVPVMLISLKAGGTGLNLTGADTVIHYDPWWNTAAMNQATDRAHRIGQTRGVQVYSLIAAGTVEERILLLQQRKRALSEGVLGGEETLFTLDADVLKELLRG